MSYSKVFKNASIYTVFSIFSKAINFLLLPLYTAYLTTADYGIVGMITALVAFLSTIYILSLQGALNRFYIEYKARSKVLDALYSTVFLTVIVNSALWTIVSFLGSKVFELLLPGVDFYPYIFWGLITVWLKPIYLIYQRILQAKQDGKGVAKLDFGQAFINIALTVFFVVVLKQKAEGIIKAQAITAFIIATVISFSFLRKLSWRFSPLLLKKTLRYSLPLIPHSLAGVTSTMLDRFVINKYLGAGEVGVYNIAFQFGNLSNLLTTAFNQAYVPWFNEQVKSNQRGKVVAVAKTATLIFSLFAMGISLFSEEILNLIAKGNFLNGAQYVPYLAFAYCFNGVYFIFATDLFYDISGKGVRRLASITIFSAFINLILNFIMVPVWGIYGAAFAFIATKLVFAIITGILVSKKPNVEVKVLPLILIVAFFFFITLVFLSFLTFISKIIVFIAIISVIAIWMLKSINNVKV